MPSEKPPRQNLFQLLPVLLWQIYLGLFYRAMGWILPKSWCQLGEPVSSNPVVGGLQRRSQGWFHRGKARHRRWWQKNIKNSALERWFRQQRYRLLGVSSALFFVFLNFVVFIAPARAVVNVVPAFSPSSINPGEVATAIVQIFNAETFQLTEADLAVNLPPGMTIANPANATTTCGSGTVNATVGDTSFDLEDGTVPPRVGNTDGTCTFSVDVTTIEQGTSNLVIPADSLETAEDETNESAGSVGLTVNPVDDPSLSKSFSPTTIFVDNSTPGAIDESVLTVTIVNNSTVDLTEVNLTDNLPAGVTTNGTATKDDATCQGGTITTGATSVTLDNVTIPAGDTCTFSVPVVSSTAGTYDNVLPANSISTAQGVSNAEEATAGLSVQDVIVEPTVSKQFRNDPVGVGDPSRLRIEIRNRSDVVDLQGVELIDLFTDPNIVIADSPNPSKETNGDCDGGGFVDDASGTPGNPAAGDNFFGIQGVTIPAGRTCRIEVNVTGTTGGIFPNTIPVGALSTSSNTPTQPNVTNSNEASDNLRVAEILVGKTYANDNTANLNVPTTLTITLENTIDVPLTGVAFTDIFTDTSPPLEIAATPNASTTCTGGSVTAVAGTDQFSLSGATIPPNDSCTVTVDVIATGTATGQNRNDINAGDVTADGGINNRFRTRRNLNVTDAPLQSIEVDKTFLDDPVNINQSATLRLRFRPSSDITDLTVTDTLPAGLVVADPASIAVGTNNCRDTSGDPRTVTATPGSNEIQISGVDILEGQRCVIRVEVESDTNGTYLNEIPVGAITTDENSTNTSAASDTLTVIGVDVEKDFTPRTIAPGGRSRLRVTFTNDQAFNLTNVNLTDNFPAGSTAIAVASPPNASTTCGAGVATATAGGTSLSLSGGTIPAAASGVSGTCTLEVDVTSNESSGSYDNTIPVGAMTTAEGVSNLEEAQATLNFSPLNLNVSKSFTPLSVTAGTSSRLTIQLFNPSPSEDYLGVAFVDNMPTGMQVFAPPNAATTCTDGVISANSGDGSFSLSDATLPANSSCTVSLDVTSTVNQTLINSIPEGGATTFQGATNTTAATASLANSPGVGVAKEFNPRIVEPGGTSRLTITIINGSDTNALTELELSDDMPSGVEFAPNPNVSTTCDGTIGTSATVTAITATDPDPDRLELTDGSLGTESSCQFSADVVVTAAGTYLNEIPQGAVSTAENASNPVAVTDTLVAAIPPSLSKVFAPDVINPTGTSTLTLTLGNTNTNAITLTSSLTDTLPTNVTVASSPNIGGTCTGTVTAAAGSSTITYANGSTIPNGGCTITVDVTSIVAGNYTNTIPAGELQTTAGNNPDPATDDLLVRTPPSVTKSFNPTSIAPNETSLLTITLGNVNTDAQTLTSDLADTLPDDVVVASPNNLGGTCTTANVTAVAGANTVTYASGSTIPNGGCTITLNVTAPTEGTKVNVIPAGDLVTDVGSNNAPTTADLVVTTVVSSDPDVILVKRITAINGTPTATIDPTSTPEPEDNDPEWPGGFLEGDVTASVVPSDVVDYTIYFLNTGDGVAENLTVCDILEPELTFIPDAYNAFSADADTGIGSGTDLGILLNDGASTKYLSALSLDLDRGRFIEPVTNLTSECDPNGTTAIDYSSAENTVVVDVTGSNTDQNPNITAGTAGFVRFRVTVD